jgi:hypothetical protein
MEFIAHTYSRFLKLIQNWQPSRSEFFETFVHQTGRTLWPGIKKRPGKSSGKCDVRRQSKIATCMCSELHLIHRPLRSGFRITSDGWWREVIKQFVVSRMNCYKLSLKMRR